MNPQTESDMRDTIKIRVKVRTGKVGSEDSTVIEFDREDWDEMSWILREEALLEDVLTSGIMNWDYEVDV